MKKHASIDKNAMFPKIAVMSRGGQILGPNAKTVTAGGNVDQTQTLWYSPEMTPTAWLLPKSRIETCFLPGTLVCNDYMFTAIESIIAGSSVLSEHGLTTVNDTHVREYSGDVYKIKPTLLPAIDCTAEHPILVVRHARCSWKGKFLCKPNCLVQKCGCQKNYSGYHTEWVDAKDVNVNDFVLFPKYKEYEKERTFDLSIYCKDNPERWQITETTIKYNSSSHLLNRYVNYSEELFRIFGWYLAEGCTGNGIQFALHQDEQDIAEFLNNAIKTIFGVSGTIKARENSKGIVLIFNSLVLERFFIELFGTGAGNKHIPEFIIKASNDLVKSFMLGWLGGDGTICEKEGKLIISTASKQLAHQALLLCSKLGFLPSLKISGKKGDKKIIKGKKTQFNYDHYIITFTKDGADKLGIPFNRKAHTKCYFEDENYFYIPVKDIQKSQYTGKVYNIATSNSTYVTTCVVHNCKWIRIYFNLDPYIQSITEMHAKYPFSSFEIECPDTTAQKIYEKAMFHGGIDWYDWVLQGSLSYQKFGEAICWGNWDKTLGRWNSFTWLDPDIVEVNQDPFREGINVELIPTMEIKKLVRDAMLDDSSKIPQVILDNVVNNRRIPLDAKGQVADIYGNTYEPPKVFIFARKTDPGAVRGTSRIQSLFQDLIYRDKIRLAQIAIADRHHLPIELWTLGHLTGDANSSIMPSAEDLENTREMIKQATAQAPFSIVATPLLKYEALGVSGKLLSVYEDLGYVENQILVGLGVNKDLIVGGSASFSNSKTLALHRLIMEYQTTRDLFTNWMKKNVLLPIAKAHNLKDVEGNYIVPEIKWKKSLRPEQDKETFDMFFKMWKEGILDTQSLFTKCPEKLDYEKVSQALEDERDSIFNASYKRIPKAKGVGPEGIQTETPPAPGMPPVKPPKEEVKETKQQEADRKKERIDLGMAGKNEPLEEAEEITPPEGISEV